MRRERQQRAARQRYRQRLLRIAGGLVGLAIVALAAIVVIQLIRSDDPNLATEAPAIPTAGPSSTASSGALATATSPAAAAPTTTPPIDLPEGVRRFVIDPAESSAKYVVMENLRLIDTTAVGVSEAVSGEIYLSPDGLSPAAASTFKVDLRELTSDEGMRDNYIKRNTLDTRNFPFAEFVIESLSGFPANYVENEQVELTLTGSMTLHGVTRPLSFIVLARQAGDTLTATADADFKMTDFGIDPPSVRIATARDEVHLQVILVARS